MVGPARAQRLESAPPVVGAERYGEQVAELAVEVHGARLGVLDRADHDITQRLQALGQETQHDALARARVAADHDVATVGDTKLDAAQEGVDSGGHVEGFDGHIGAKRVEFQAIERLKLGIHDSGSSVSVGVSGLGFGQVGGRQSGGGVVGHQVSQQRRDAHVARLALRIRHVLIV